MTLPSIRPRIIKSRTALRGGHDANTSQQKGEIYVKQKIMYLFIYYFIVLFIHFLTCDWFGMFLTVFYFQLFLCGKANNNNKMYICSLLILSSFIDCTKSFCTKRLRDKSLDDHSSMAEIEKIMAVVFLEVPLRSFPGEVE